MVGQGDNSDALVSVVVPVCNETPCLAELFDRLTKVAEACPERFEFVFVDDGSTDGSDELIERFARQDPRVRFLILSRNFGHEKAITAGLDHAAGDAVVLIDADCQDPPEVIPQLIAKWREGYQVVYGRRLSRPGENPLKRATSWAFYRIIRWLGRVELPVDTGDFRLMDALVVRQVRRCREENRFVRGLVAWTGFRQTAVGYHREPRCAGQTKYGLMKLTALAVDAVVGFSNAPLRLMVYVGLTVCGLSMALGARELLKKLLWDIDIPGYALEITAIFFLNGVQLCMLGVLGEYVGRIYTEAQDRPLYLIARRSDPPAPPNDPPADNARQSADPD